MGQALYRKHRSRSFDEVVGQDHIVRTLKSALKNGRVSHAYLFTGPRGVGKTSVARILAYEVNGMSYKDGGPQLDIIEIDAASNRRIDEIRELRDRVNIAPATAKYKVYIIDEVHMLTREAFNALLKTLEEPPAHVIFILATTEAHKLPETIISRTQRFEFKPVSQAVAAKHLKDLSKAEKIKISDEALDLLAQFGNGSFRDSIGYLDQLGSLNKEITANDVRDILGLPTAQSIDELLALIKVGDSAGLIEKLTGIEEQGVSPASAAAGLAAKLRTEIINGETDRRLLGLLSDLSRVTASSRPQEALEIALLSASSEYLSDTKPHKPSPSKVSSVPVVTEKKQDPAVSKDSFSLDQWDEVLAKTKAQAASIYTALRLAEPEYDNGVLTLKFRFSLHQKKLSSLENRDMVAKIIKQVSGQNVTVRAVLSEEEATESIVEAVNQPVSAINSIFGGAEVLEA